MNIDITNALRKVISICNSLSLNTDYEQILFKDIYSFISNISIKNANERFDYFCKIYLANKVNANTFAAMKVEELPKLLKTFCQIDNKLPETSKGRTSKALIALFYVLGKYYLSSRIDKEEIDSQRFVELIKKMNEQVATKGPQIEISESSTQISDEINKAPVRQFTPTNTSQTPAETPEEAFVETHEETLGELMDTLNSMIGLENVKKQVKDIINLIQLQRKSEEFGLKMQPLSLHSVFYGNPGTGKTTVARLLAKIYKKLGVLSGGQLIEVDRGGLVAGYVGQTATKTQEVLDNANGGILFIDEAYTLTHGKGETDFGQEAVDTILKAMEDRRSDFIVIVAGYPELMKEFIASNPGLKSRFNQYINFEDYLPSELCEIFTLLCNQHNLILDAGAIKYRDSYFQKIYENRDENYANGRAVRNFFDNVTKARANRLAPNINAVTYNELTTILESDLIAAAELQSDL